MKLPYLADLGITGIYLNPVMESESNHKYDTTDYTKIDPSFGDNASMRRMVDEAHRLGIRVMVDAVFNHCGRKFTPGWTPWRKGEASRYADWFMVNDWSGWRNGAIPGRPVLYIRLYRRHAEAQY